MSLLQKFANAARLQLGAPPLIVTTSVTSAVVESESSPLETWLRKGTVKRRETLPAQFMAVATEGLRHPEAQRWNVTLKIKDAAYDPQEVLKDVSYKQMIDFMKERELMISRESGFHGSADEVINERKNVVSKTNVFRFV